MFWKRWHRVGLGRLDMLSLGEMKEEFQTRGETEIKAHRPQKGKEGKTLTYAKQFLSFLVERKNTMSFHIPEQHFNSNTMNSFKKKKIKVLFI